jgi:hypothetical protein
MLGLVLVCASDSGFGQGAGENKKEHHWWNESYPGEPLKNPWEPKWDEDFGFAAEHYPVVATEFGFWAGTDAICSR